MMGDDFRRRADAVRSIPLESVLTQWGAKRDRRDRSRWQTERGSLSITGSKFFNWHLNQGRGGAIDLVMHLGAMDYRAAVRWLEQHLGQDPGSDRVAASSITACSRKSSSRVDANIEARPPQCPLAASSRPLRLPVADDSKLDRVRHYLTEQRCLSVGLLEPLIASGKVYADGRSNAVFLMVAGKAHRSIGAELRGTGKRVWQGLAPGTRKDAGYFWIGVEGSQGIILCESAIDAISCFQLHPASICISTAGVRPSPDWLYPLLARGYAICCGFDDDAAGNAASREMISRHPAIQRLLPPGHDWNDAVVAAR